MISIDWTLGLQFANFFILMMVLNVILYRPLRDMIRRRREAVAADHQKSADLEAQINDKMARYQEKLQAAKLQSNSERAVLRQEAQNTEAKELAVARQEAADHVQKIKNSVAAEAQTARQTLKGEAEQLAGLVAAKVLGRAL